MTKEDYISKFSNARKRYKELINSIDYDSLLLEKSKYQEKTGDPNFWDDNSLAKQILKNISSYEKEIEEYDLIKQSYEDMSINFDSNVNLALSNSSINSVDSVIILQTNNEWKHVKISENQFQLVSEWAFLIGFCLSVLLMIILYVRPEWYVVNLVGILVGAGVVAMLGISFVPWLIIIFMIVAAIYDAWAVYKSKHMLDLADTMVNLKLPILLVAPQEKNYSFLGVYLSWLF